MFFIWFLHVVFSEQSFVPLWFVCLIYRVSPYASFDPEIRFIQE